MGRGKSAGMLGWLASSVWLSASGGVPPKHWDIVAVGLGDWRESVEFSCFVTTGKSRMRGFVPEKKNREVKRCDDKSSSVRS